MKTPSRTSARPDYWILALAGALVVIGLQAVYSSSFAIGLAEYDNPNYFFARQLMWAALGSVLMLITMRIDYRYWRKWSPYLMVATIVMLLLILLPGFGVGAYGATRWLKLGPLPAFQPSEFIKLSFVAYLAAWLASRPERVKSLSGGFLPFGIVTGLIVALIMKEPDLGTAMVISFTSVTLFFMAGADLKYFVPSLVGGLGVGAVLINIEGYRLSRWMAFVDPWEDPAGKGFHIIQLLIAMGSGGIEGRGIGASRQKFFYVPGSHTDGIFAIIGEELGFIGACLVIGLFVALFYRGFRVVFRSRDPFASLFAAGILFWFAYQAIINIGGVIRAIPLAGIPLPFISYGGSALAMTMAATGILINISRHAEQSAPAEAGAPVSTAPAMPMAGSAAGGNF